MDGRGNDEESLIFRVEELQRERDGLKKDIEQLCMQQAGPSYLAVATRMHFQRTSALEQEIDSLRKKLAGLTREKQNLQEELSQAYHIKTQLADLHSAEVLKNKEAEKQVKFFQNCVAAAFSERDHSLMESEKVKEQEEAMSQKLIDYETRLAEIQSSYLREKEINAALQIELRELNEQNDMFKKVINKFIEVRERDTGFSVSTWEDKCSCLLDDPLDHWIFNSDSVTSTSKYISALEEELETLRNKIDKLQNNLRMGLEIEQHLKRNVQCLEKKQILLDDMLKNWLSTFRGFHTQHRTEIHKLLEEEGSYMNSVIFKVQEKMRHNNMNSELNFEELRRGDCDVTVCRDFHISNDVQSNVLHKNGDFPTTSFSSNETPDALGALAQALQEKVSALLLLSQQEERHLLERDVNAALLKRIEELQRNLSQATNEKVKALLELAELKGEHQLSLEKNAHGMKYGGFLADGSECSDIVSEREGKIKNLLKRTYLRKWIRKDFSEHEISFPGNSYGNTPTNRNTYSSMEFARLKVENAALQESVANMEHLTSSIHRLHVSLLKANEHAMSATPSGSVTEALTEVLSGIIQESNHMKTALGSSLPVSWSDDSTNSITYESLYEPAGPSESPIGEKPDPFFTAGVEMVELLILAAQILKEHLKSETASTHN